MDTLESIEYKGHVINVYPDEGNDSPREWDNLGTFVCVHRRYNIGDKNFNSLSAWENDPDCGVDKIGLPVYMYDHSGITISTEPFSCPWDSGQVGFIYVTLDKIRSEYWKRITKARRLKIESYLKAEIELLDQYLRGEVYGYQISGPFTDDSCWGFYDKEDMISEAKGIIDWNIEHTELDNQYASLNLATY